MRRRLLTDWAHSREVRHDQILAFANARPKRPGARMLCDALWASVEKAAA